MAVARSRTCRSREYGGPGSPPPRFRSSPPAPVQPQPLVGMLAHPAFDHRGDLLHCALHIDLALRIAPRLDWWREVGTKAIAIGQAHHARAVNRAFDVASKPGNQRVGFARPPEECHVDAV